MVDFTSGTSEKSSDMMIRDTIFGCLRGVRGSEQNKRLFDVFVSHDDDLPSSEPSSAEVNLFESRGHGETRASGTRLDLVPE